MKLSEEAEKKRREIAAITKNVVVHHVCSADKVSDAIVNCFCIITPSEDDDHRRARTTVRRDGLGGGRSSKASNILLNWRRLLIDGAESILCIAGAIAVPWLIPLAGLVIWDRVWSLLNIDIDERHAVVIWTMWKNRDKERRIADEKILGLVNKELRKFNRCRMSAEELRVILNDLAKMHCIAKIHSHDSIWWLREWVSMNY